MSVFGIPVTGTNLFERAAAVAVVAASFADDVDQEGRFPQEAVAAMKQNRLLGAMLPIELGGEGTSLGDVSEIASLIAQHCASAGTIYVLHQIQVALLLRLAATSAQHRTVLRQIADDQLLLSGASTEVGANGDPRSSLCRIELSEETYAIEKTTAAIAYAAHADMILALAQHGSDPVVVVVSDKDRTLDKTSTWDTLGLRGLGADGFRLKATGPAANVLPHPFDAADECYHHTTSHLLWAALSHGIARGAVEIAQAFTSAQGAMNAAPAVEVARRLRTMAAMRRDGLHRFEQALASGGDLSAAGLSAKISAIKVATSRIAIDIVNAAVTMCGVQGLKVGSPFSVGCQFRDSLAAQVLMNNETIFGAPEMSASAGTRKGLAA